MRIKGLETEKKRLLNYSAQTWKGFCEFSSAKAVAFLPLIMVGALRLGRRWGTVETTDNAENTDTGPGGSLMITGGWTVSAQTGDDRAGSTANLAGALRMADELGGSV